MADSKTTTWQSEFLSDREADHPWYGGCDGLLPDGGCAECEAIRWQPGYAEVKARWWVETQKQWSVHAARKERRAAKRQAKREALNV